MVMAPVQVGPSDGRQSRSPHRAERRRRNPARSLRRHRPAAKQARWTSWPRSAASSVASGSTPSATPAKPTSTGIFEFDQFGSPNVRSPSPLQNGGEAGVCGALAASIDPADWQLAVRCNCGDWIVVGPSEGPSCSSALPATLHLTCDSCGKSADYGFKDLRHLRTVNREPQPRAHVGALDAQNPQQPSTCVDKKAPRFRAALAARCKLYALLNGARANPIPPIGT